ncbi:MAG TPA: hypothetical protein OQH54_07020 [Nitrosopumilus sp.]|nr:hypothetical protein [Thermoproteota archaeon]HJJ23449.1 hypothetical protein [Nitrosopumilus sp.]
MKTAFIGILTIILIGSFSIQSVSGHQSDFIPNTAEGILEFCAFFYEEYKILGADGLASHHPNFPNLRECVNLYKHVAWNSTHELRDRVLIDEIEKYLGDSNHIKERHLSDFTIMPDWIKVDLKLWTDGNSKDSQFAYGIRAMLENNVLSPPIIDNISNRVCNEEGLCMKETDYFTYSHTSKFENTTTEKFEIEKIDSNGILINIKRISEEKVETNQFYLDENTKIPTEEKCCKTVKFLYKTPIEVGQTIEDGYKIIGTTDFSIEGLIRVGLVAQNSDKTRLLIIDKETGFLLSEKFEKTLITTDWEKSSLLNTNVFHYSVGIQLHDLEIPKWLKTSTMWFTEGLTSESEYINAVEYLIGKKILIV